MIALIKKYNKRKVKQIVKQSKSFYMLLRKLGYSSFGTREYAFIKKYLIEHNISTKHFIGIKKHPIKDVFCINSIVSPSVVRDRYIKIVKYICVECGQGDIHNNKLLVLQIDHINGNNKDNRLTNLRLLCPNCHTQTSTFAGRSMGPKRIDPRTRSLQYYDNIYKMYIKLQSYSKVARMFKTHISNVRSIVKKKNNIKNNKINFSANH